MGLIVANGRSVGFGYRLREGDSVLVYPVRADITITPIVKLRDEPLRKNTFILDVHLGKLTKMLRMLWFDTVYENDYDDPEIIRRSLQENRIIITRDRILLHAKVVPTDTVFDQQIQKSNFARCLIGLISISIYNHSTDAWYVTVK